MGSVTTGENITGLNLPSLEQALKLPNKRRLAVICSHDCDIENPRGRTALLLAPLVKVPAKPSGPEFPEIMGSHSPVDGQYSWFPLFPVVLPAFGHETDVSSVVDFSSVMSLGKAERARDSLRETKLFEMTDDYRGLFKTKLAIFLGRP